LKLDASRFEGCYTGKIFQRKIEDGVREGTANNVRATPTFFFGNVRLEGAIPNSSWDALLTKMTNGS
jgi:protein-disulfide isomerase